MPQLSICNTSDVLRLLWVHLPTEADHHFNFFPWDLSGCDSSIATNALLRISALLSRRTHCCHWATSMMQQVTGGNQRTHPASAGHFTFQKNRFSNTLQLHPSYIPNHFILGWPPPSCNVATNDLHTCCPIALDSSGIAHKDVSHQCWRKATSPPSTKHTWPQHLTCTEYKCVHSLLSTPIFMEDSSSSQLTQTAAFLKWAPINVLSAQIPIGLN